MSKGKRTAKRTSSAAKRRRTAATSRSIGITPGATKRSWLSTRGYVIISAIMVIILGASVLTFLGPGAFSGGPAPAPTSESNGVPSGAILDETMPIYASVSFVVEGAHV
ncbi:MAG: hypothetical protein EPO21_00960 [Chloroflexota bacterium]|nr:MAG: hypothetical protein EPO21_00960 [Chloroflexota bacterium]